MRSRLIVVNLTLSSGSTGGFAVGQTGGGSISTVTFTFTFIIIIIITITTIILIIIIIITTIIITKVTFRPAIRKDQVLFRLGADSALQMCKLHRENFIPRFQLINLKEQWKMLVHLYYSFHMRLTTQWS